MQESSLLPEGQTVNLPFDSEEEGNILDSNNVKLESDTTEEVENIKESNRLELQTLESAKEKVIPLYAPDDAVVKVFMVHSSQKSALVLATYALGFQQQVVFIYQIKSAQACKRMLF